MKKLKIEVPKGYEIDKENSTFENIVFKEIKKGLPKTWEDLEKIKGHYVNLVSEVYGFGYRIKDVSESDKNVFATKEQAKASIALAQLSQLRDIYRNGWVPDWIDNKKKYCILIVENEITTLWLKRTNQFLSFQDAKTRDLFFENFRDLIEQAKPLMS